MFAPHANVWNFDLGKLVVPSVFMDCDLLEAIAKKYGQAIWVVRRTNGMPLISISSEEIREVFKLEPLSDYHVPISLPELENEYKEKKDEIRKGALRAHIRTMGAFPVIIVASREPFKRSLFTSWVVEIYRTLCRVLGEDEQDFMPIDLMYMMIQIASFGVDVIFYFASFLAKEIHNGLVGIAKGKLDKNLWALLYIDAYVLVQRGDLFWYRDGIEKRREWGSIVSPVMECRYDLGCRQC